MRNDATEELQTGNDLNTLGFATNLAKRGIIKLMFGILITILLLQFGIIIWQQRALNEIQKTQSKASENQSQFLMELLKGYEKTKNFVDSSHTAQ